MWPRVTRSSTVTALLDDERRSNYQQTEESTKQIQYLQSQCTRTKKTAVSPSSGVHHLSALVCRTF